MQNLCVLGLQWGDEGKGKIVDLLAADFDIVARYQGGSNAGHTVCIGDEKFVLHLVPSGILQGADCVIGNGVAVDPILLVKEIDALQERGIRVEGRLFVSDRAHVVMPYHKALDGQDGRGPSGPRIGTTGQGIGPCYADKTARMGIRMVELLRPESFRNRLQESLPVKNRLLRSLFGLPPIRLEDVFEPYAAVADRLRPLVCDTVSLLHEAMAQGRRILFEGAQGVMLDLDFGTYPYVTSSHPGVSGILSGLGISPKAIGTVAGVMKAYTTRVGEGPFPTQGDPATDERLRNRGGEYGATTGRPRRCGWFDAVAVRHAIRLNGVDTIALTKLDVLAGEREVRVCTAYRCNGARLSVFPPEADSLERCEPEYETFHGWPPDMGRVTRFEDLPPEARRYVEALETLVGVPIGAVSLGPERDQLVLREGWAVGKGRGGSD